MLSGRAVIVLISLLLIISFKELFISVSIFLLILSLLLLISKKGFGRNGFALVMIPIMIILMRYQYWPNNHSKYVKIYSQSYSNNSYVYKTNSFNIVHSYYLEPGWEINITQGSVSKNGYMYYPKLDVVSKHTNFFYKIKSKIMQDIGKVSGGNSKALFGGVLLGDTSGFDNKYKQSLNILGLSHIISVSGYNLTVIASWLRKKYSNVAWHSFRTINIIIAIWLFVMISGMGSAVLRAAFMLTIFLILTFYYIEIDILSLFLISSSLMLIINPLFLTDISWQLSSGATLGIILFATNIKAYLDKFPLNNKIMSALNDNISITIGANIITVMIVAFYFHSLSTLTIISNILIVPLVPIIMIIGILAFIGAQISTSITIFLLSPLLRIIDFMLLKLELLSRLSIAKISFGADDLKIFMIIWAGLILLILIRRIHHKESNVKHKQDSGSLIFNMR